MRRSRATTTRTWPPDERTYQRMRHRENRLARHASRIAHALEAHGVDACPGCCGGGAVSVIITHHGHPDPDARDPVRCVEYEGEIWEECLLFQGEQIPVVLSRMRELARYDVETALAMIRTAQDVLP